MKKFTKKTKILASVCVCLFAILAIGAVNTAYWGPFGAWNLDLDDGSGDSPWLGMTDGDDNYIRIQKLDAGAATITNNEGAINVLAAGDTDDYLTITTTTNVPTIGTTGSCNLAITSSSGTVSFADDNLTTTGTLDFDGIRISKASEAIAVGDFTDVDTSGYLDLTAKIPAGSLVLGFTFVGSGAFDGDSTAVMEVGIEGDTDAFSALTTGSVVAASTIGSGANADAAFCAAETTVRVTVTGGADFTSIKTAANGAGTITVWYIKPAS